MQTKNLKYVLRFFLDHIKVFRQSILAGILVCLSGISANAQLLHRYDFSTGANDSVGTANGTLEGSATISGGSLNSASVAGGLSGGVPQNGLMLPSSAVAGITNAFTVETWFVANYGGGFTTLFSFSGNNTASYVLATPARGNSPYASTISVIGGGGSNTEQQASEQYQDNGVLHDMVVTYDGTALSYYIDGALGSFSGLPPTITDPGLNLSTLTYIGINGGSPWADNSINGSTLDFRIYGQSLNAAQAASLYALGSDASTSAISNAIANAVATNSVSVDSSIALTNYTGLGEWNTNGNFENWTTAGVSGAVVLGGTLSGTGSAATAQISLLNITNGPDLDLGFNDYLDLRIQVPAVFTGDVRVYYGSSYTSGISASRMLTIPNAVIPKDGAAHSYRLALGLEVPWRGNLTDLRIELTSASGVGFAVDYLHIGDLTGEVYQPRYTTECPAAGGTTPSGALFGGNLAVSSVESKHFRFLWNAAVATNSFWTTNMPHGTLRNAEEAWQVMIKKLGYREPCFATETQSSTKYKLNITTWYSGYWEGNDTYSGATLARLNITPDGIRVDPPGLVLPHEFTHCIQTHNTTGYVPGSWWEGHANYGRERYLEHFGALFASNARSGIDPTYLRCAHQLIAEGRDYYLSWPMFLYLDENPDGLSDLGEGTMVKLWQQCQINEYPLMTLERLTPTNNIKDIVGYFARREATFNYAHKADIQAALATFGQPLDNAATARWQFTDLVQRSDDTNWWRVPFEMAPMQGAYAIHELVPIGSGAGRVVTVNFHGLPDSTRGADWRASFIVISDSGVERYSTLWSNGVNSVTLAANENKVYLSVAGAPATFYTGSPNNSFAGDYDESVYPYRSTPSKTRFPYELQITGATAKQRDNGATTGLVQHSNGGGYKLSSVTVPATVYIGPNARVLGGTVSGNARIEDYAVVTAGTVNGNAVISGHAWVRGGTVTDNAKVRDWALVEGGTISLNGRVLEHANIKGGTVTGNATAKGTAASLTGTISGTAMIDGDYGDFFYGRDVTNGVAFGHLPYVGVPDNFIHPLPGGIYAAYDFATAHDSRILDQYGVTDGFLQGSPTWYASDGRRQGFLAFNGVNQAVTLDRSLCDLHQTTIAAWVKWSGGVSNQPVWYFGAATNKCMYLTPDDGTGHAKFFISNGGATQTLAWTSPLPIGVWTHTAVTIDGTNATFYVNGNLAASAANTNRPEQLLAPNTATNSQQNYLARGTGNSLPFFQGALDDVRVYSTVLVASDIAALQPPANFIGTGTLYVDLRATNISSGSPTTFTTWTNFGVSVGNFTKSGTTTYTNNVLATQIPGVLFDGTSGLYTSANTSLADLTGASDRTLEVWVYNPALATEETMVSLGDRSGTRKDCAFNFGNAAGWGAVTHFGDDVSWGTLPSANAWHHLVYTYDGTTNVQIYVDGSLWTSDMLAGVLVTPTGDPINIGCQRGSAGGNASQFFSGYLNTVRVWGGVTTPAQVAANYLFGPWLSSVAKPINFAAISNVTLNVGVTLNVTNSATDPNQPPLPLMFSIVSAPTNATINPSSGLFIWRPVVTQANFTNVITLRVVNNAAPGLSATQSFMATINSVSTPSMSNAQLSSGAFSFQIAGGVGPDYLIQTSTNLSAWSTVLNTNPVTMPFLWADSNPANDSARFYRVLLGP